MPPRKVPRKVTDATQSKTRKARAPSQTNHKKPLKKKPTKRVPLHSIDWGLNRKRKANSDEKRFRQVKVVRPYVIRLIFLVPLCIILLERYLGLVISLDDVSDLYNEQLGIEPWQFPPPTIERIGQVPDIINLTFSPHHRCPDGQQRMMSVHNPQHLGETYRKIPRYVHQTSFSKCLPNQLFRASVRWAFRRYTYRFHDMEAVMRVLNTKFPEFPRLTLLTGSDCLSPPMKVGLWKFLTLWLWGGIYADLNSVPVRFNGTTITNDDDGFFLLQPGNSGNLSSSVMAVSPRHPLMYYAVQHTISNIMRIQPGELYNPQEVFGDGVLQQAYRDFVKRRSRPRTNETFHREVGRVVLGKHDRFIRIAETFGEDEKYIARIFDYEPERQDNATRIAMFGGLENTEYTSSCAARLVPW